MNKKKMAYKQGLKTHLLSSNQSFNTEQGLAKPV